MERKKITTFEELLVWQKGIALIKEVYLFCSSAKISKDFGLKDQIQRAAVSIPTNIAEGFEMASRKEYLQFLNIAKGSAGELRSLLRVAYEIEYLSQEQYNRLNKMAIEVSSYLANQIKSIKGAEK
jgi:four helix bundle protein